MSCRLSDEEQSVKVILREACLTITCLTIDCGMSPDLVAQCVHELARLRVWLVGVYCALPELERRERVRGDRIPGLAQQQFHTIHVHARYDIEVDMSRSSVEECRPH